MGGITTAAVSLSAARLCFATGGVLSVDASFYGIVGHLSFSFFFPSSPVVVVGESCVWLEKAMPCGSRVGEFPAREGEGSFFQHESTTFSRLGQAHLFGMDRDDFIKVEDQRGNRETSRDHSVRSRTRNLLLRCSARKCLLGSFSP